MPRQNRALIHPGLAKNDGIDEYDVNHRQKRRYARDEFGTDVGALPGKSEISIKRRRGFSLGFLRCRRPLWLFDHFPPPPPKSRFCKASAKFYLFVRPDVAVVHNVTAVPLRFIALLEHNRLPCFEACDYN